MARLLDDLAAEDGASTKTTHTGRVNPDRAGLAGHL